MYVVMNELHVPKEAKAHLSERFGKSAEKMGSVPGCIEFMFLNNEKEDGKQIVFTKWESKQDYENWLHSDAFKRAHQEKRESKEKGPTTSNELNAYEVLYQS
ncbi:antibiotic biosynthesis monooxygenase family protein [Bacillus alkalicellulosilyticus]|uniref:antibiotic biosynthesis monooxygenase family protein n=1 Tax=Alkalihalobacterium alkalicellulosilyticum TaxID=1912214 RepID=UPI00099720FE|nr:antibiotic biosynthesis monooxygenase family protein [Bacillus alkalicellulosilyticus]